MKTKHGVALAPDREINTLNQEISDLRKSGDQLRLILDTLTECVYEIDLEGNCTYCNAAFLRTLGFSRREEVLGKNVHQLIHSKAADGTPIANDACRMFLAFRAGQEIIVDDEVFWCRDGTPFHVEYQSLLKKENGEVTGQVVVFRDITERKKGEDALQHVSAELRKEKAFRDAILDSATYTIISVDMAGTIQTFNRTAEQLLGYAAEEVIGIVTPVLFHDPGEIAERARSLSQELKETIEPGFDVFVAKARMGLSDEQEWSYRRKDGTVFPIFLSVTGLWSSEGTLEGFVGIGRDITEEKRTKRHLDMLFDLSADMISIIGIDGYFKKLNRAFEKTLGYSLEQICEKPFFDFVHPKDIEKTGKEFEQLLAGAPVVNFENRYRTAGGGYKWLSWTSQPMPDGLFFSIARDVTSQKELMLSLAKNEARMRTILDNVVDGIITIDSAGIIQTFNRAASRIFGFSADETVGKNVSMLMPEPIRREHDGYLRRYLETGRRKVVGSTHEVTGKRKDGTEFTLELAVDEADLNGTKIFTGVFRDITERKRMIADVVKAREVAEEATRAKSVFLANMSHEIRTPMNAIIGMAHLALRTGLDARQRDYIGKIQAAGFNLLGIINDILDFSKIEAGKLSIESTVFDLNEVLGNVSTVVGTRAFEKGLELVFHVSPGVGPIFRGDPLRLGQILTNLAGNAVKFTEKGEITIRVEMAETFGERARLRFAVTDTGVGISPEQMARLFRDFSQADGSTTRKYGGTGLGLTISKRLVELMGGEIGVESALGRGSVFHFTVWLEAASRSDAASVMPEAVAGGRVLIVDDNDTARAVLRESLEELGLRVTEASSGAEAVAVVKDAEAREPFALICMDWKMPEMDGMEAARIIRTNLRLERMPKILLVTAFGQETMQQDDWRSWIDGLASKPVTVHQLNAAICRLYSTADHAAETPQPAPSRGKKRLRNMSILLVEDNAINQQIAMEFLQSEGAVVDVAENGREGVENVLRSPAVRPYDVVLMDLHMPGMDGFTATQQIRLDPRFQTLPILAMTASATVAEREQCLVAGMNDHIAKPIDPELLTTTLARYAKASPAAAPAEEDTENPPIPGDGPESRAREDDLLQEISPLPGMDTNIGLRRVANNRMLYINLLKRFVEDHGDMSRQIRNVLAAGDRSTAERMAHSMKGVAGNIGAVDVSRLAAGLEETLRAHLPDEQVERQLVRFSGALDTLVRALRTIFEPLPDQNAAGERAESVEPAGVLDQLRKLVLLLEASDIQAVHLFGDIRPGLVSLGIDASLASFEKALRNLDFDICRDMVREFEERLQARMKG